ncbi:hypothetical protein [Thermophagus xiamenensis]|uniref:Uncharacterized protein n=1 Tax=Thermophagus xiamenensis TaxID=385682 RepID=A0A1I2DCU4_9BACT|nr:hypothetical protein [Thermophagus xiamenensis]SFE78366.1 hypothetical protein SAMN05444380_11868 [Thermophagus xiamenensis]
MHKCKKPYTRPELQEVSLDRHFLLLAASEDGPPGQGGLFSTLDSEINSTSTDYNNEDEDILKQNSFDDNPFQR